MIAPGGCNNGFCSKRLLLLRHLAWRPDFQHQAKPIRSNSTTIFFLLLPSQLDGKLLPHILQHYLAVEQADNAVCIAGIMFRVGYHDHRCAGFV